ncbi:MAG: aspartate/glutamate racemase family protein [Candidatus Levyibacteriota bacterium]
MKHIGIAGITIPGSLLCIDAIVEESYRYFGKEKTIHPHITYTNPSLSEIDPPIIAKDWNKVAEDLLRSISILEKAGVDFVIIPSNSPHYAIKKVQQESLIPVMSIVDVVVAECQKRGFKKVGILGVAVTMSDGLYEEPLREVGIQSVVLSPKSQKEVNDLIYAEIIKGKPTSKTGDKMRVFIQELKDVGCDAFIAGCTEIPVVITKESESPLPFIDTTRLLAKKAFEEAIK